VNKIIYGLISFTTLDILYTTIGAFYGGGGAELNPLFNWLSDPIEFIIFIAITKAIAIGMLIWGIWWLNEHEKRHHFQYARALGIGANVVYAGLLFGILWVNIGYRFL
jgi:uncharacterized RDD family membrane protein YckC